jgi:glucose/arabinose dehydrogenase
VTPARSRLRLGLLVVSALAAAALAALVPGASAHSGHPVAGSADTTGPGLVLRRVGSFSFPVYVTSPPGDNSRQFVVEQDGRIKLIKDGRVLARPFLDVSSLIDFQGERGLLSMAFPPDYEATRRFYIYYTARDGDLTVDELRRSASNPDVANRNTRRRVIEIPHSQFGNHNGGQLQMGSSGRLYISTGDGGGGNDQLGHGQNVNTLLGKVLRIDPRQSGSRPYTIPSSNPFVGRAGGDHIWAYGLRNPWRFSFDRATGDMAIGDVGQREMEEVDFTRAGRSGMNFGWGCFEGTLPFNDCNAPGHVTPVLEYRHDAGGCAVTGGYVVRDPRVSRLVGKYVYGDYCSPARRHATRGRRHGRGAPQPGRAVAEQLRPGRAGTPVRDLARRSGLPAPARALSGRRGPFQAATAL